MRDSLDPDSETPLFEQLAAVLRDAITAGELTGKLPGQQDMAAYSTMRRACQELSAFLDARAPGGGHDPRMIGEEHVLMFVADQYRRARESGVAVSRG